MLGITKRIKGILGRTGTGKTGEFIIGDYFYSNICPLRELLAYLKLTLAIISIPVAIWGYFTTRNQDRANKKTF